MDFIILIPIELIIIPIALFLYGLWELGKIMFNLIKDDLK